MSKKLEKYEILNRLKYYNLTPLNIDDYKGVSDRIMCIGVDGYKYNVKLSSISDNTMPRMYDKSNPESLNNLKLYIKNNNIDFLLAENQEYNGKYGKLKFICKEHGVFYKTIGNIKRGQCCPYCNDNSGVLSDKNRISSIRPDLIKYIKNKADADNYSINSGKSVIIVCDKCKNEREVRIQDFVRYGVRCKKCHNIKISIPEKFARGFLNEVGLDFIPQYKPSWSEGKIYDFYIPSLNMIIETHGEQHYKERGLNSKFKLSLLEQVNIDVKKRNLAKINGIEKYAELDCRVSDMKYLKKVFSNYFKFINLESIDWGNVYEFCNSDFVDIISEYYNNGFKIKDISKKLKIHVETVSKYLNIGNDLGLCNYIKDKNVKFNIHKYDMDMNFIFTYKSSTEISKELNVRSSCIRRNVDTGKLYRGFYWYRELK